MTKNPETASPYLNVEQTAKRLIVKPSTLNKWRHLGIGPVFRTHGGRIVYLIADLDSWSESQKRQKSIPPLKHKSTTSKDGNNK